MIAGANLVRYRFCLREAPLHRLEPQSLNVVSCGVQDHTQELCILLKRYKQLLGDQIVGSSSRVRLPEPPMSFVSVQGEEKRGSKLENVPPCKEDTPLLQAAAGADVAVAVTAAADVAGIDETVAATSVVAVAVAATTEIDLSFEN